MITDGLICLSWPNLMTKQGQKPGSLHSALSIVSWLCNSVKEKTTLDLSPRDFLF